MNEDRELLPDETYRFFQLTLVIRTNSTEVRDFLRTVYGRFRDPEAAPLVDDEHAFVLNVVDDIADSGRLVVEDRLSSHTLWCKSLTAFDVDRYDGPFTVPDPLTNIQWLVLNIVANLAEDHLLIHAGSVAWNGSAVILPGDSGRGKTTLTLKLALEGFDFLSDEVACLRADRDTVEPFLRRVNLSERSRELLGLRPFTDVESRVRGDEEREWVLDIADICPVREAGAPTLRHVVFLTGFGESPRLEPLSAATGLFTLLRYSHRPIEDPGAALCRYAPLLRNVSCHDLVVGDLSDTAALLKDLVGSGAGGSPA